MVERLISFKDIPYIIRGEVIQIRGAVAKAFWSSEALTFEGLGEEGEQFNPHIRLDKELLKDMGIDSALLSATLQDKIREITGYEHSSLTEGEKDITIACDFRGKNFNHEAIQHSIREYADSHPKSVAMEIIKNHEKLQEQDEKTLATQRELTIPLSTEVPFISSDPYHIFAESYIDSIYQDSGLLIENAETMKPYALRQAMVEHYKQKAVEQYPERAARSMFHTIALDAARQKVDGYLEEAASNAYKGKGGINQAMEDAYTSLIVKAGVKIDNYFESLLTPYPKAMQDEAKAIYYEGKNVRIVKDLIKNKNAVGFLGSCILDGEFRYQVQFDEEVAKSSLYRKLVGVHEITHWLQKRQQLEILKEDYKTQFGIVRTLHEELVVIPTEDVLYKAIPRLLFIKDMEKMDPDTKQLLISECMRNKKDCIETNLDNINPLYNSNQEISNAGFQEILQKIEERPDVRRWKADMYYESDKPVEGRDLTEEQQQNLRKTWEKQVKASRQPGTPTR